MTACPRCETWTPRNSLSRQDRRWSEHVYDVADISIRMSEVLQRWSRPSVKIKDHAQASGSFFFAGNLWRRACIRVTSMGRLHPNTRKVIWKQNLQFLPGLRLAANAIPTDEQCDADLNPLRAHQEAPGGHCPVGAADLRHTGRNPRYFNVYGCGTVAERTFTPGRIDLPLS